MPVFNFNKKKNLLVITILVIIVLISGNLLYYKSLYNKQLHFRSELLEKQVQKAGAAVDSINDNFLSDLNQIIFAEDISVFFSDPDHRETIIGRMKSFFSDYYDLITGIKLYDNNRNEFTLKKDETGQNWLEQIFILHVQGEILSREVLKPDDRNFEFYLPVLKNNSPVGNIVVSINFQKYFEKVFSAFDLDDYQWQWVVNDSGTIIYSNNITELKYKQLNEITVGLDESQTGNLIQRAENTTGDFEILSSYYPVQLLYEKMALVFSTPAENFRISIISSSIIMGLLTLISFLLIIEYFRRNLKLRETEIDKLKTSEEVLFKIFDDMPVGIIIHNADRKIIKANNKAAEFYSYSGTDEMTGINIPETTMTDSDNYFSKHLGSSFSPDQFLIIKKESEDLILFRNSVPVRFRDENVRMEMLVDVTTLESARKQEANASSAKSDFLARISYEIRTPINGIIGMIDILQSQQMTDEAIILIGLLRKSTEVLIKIIDDILDFSKIETGKISIDEIPFNLREEIIYCYDVARKSINDKCITIDCMIQENVPDNVIGDPFRFRQILTNFLNHSVKDTKKGKIILKCTLKERTNETIKLLFELSDTGKSYNRNELTKIFGNNDNPESKTYDNLDQSDFATVIAGELISLMGGEIYAESPSGLNGDTGKKIEFTLDLYSNDKPVKDLHFSDIITFDQLKTLVITGNNSRDEEILGILHKLGLALTVTSFQKSTIAQLKAGLNFPEKRNHLIIIMDDKEFNGFEVAQEIWKSDLAQQFVIMIISSNDRNGNLLKCNKLGVDHYLLKSSEIKDLYEAIKISFSNIDKASPAGGRENARKDLRILVVDDNKMNQKVIGTMLKSMGYSFDFADDGFAALIQAKTRKYDIIFMDLIMPEMDGFESARKILEYNSKQLIVAFTADNLPESKRKAELSGIMEFIAKPVRLEDLKKLFSKYFIKA